VRSAAAACDPHSPPIPRSRDLVSRPPSAHNSDRGPTNLSSGLCGAYENPRVFAGTARDNRVPKAAMDVIADPDCRLFTLMAAYAALEVPCSASAAEIRRADRHLMLHDHPDLHRAGSEDHRNAMARMAAIDDAYDLVRDAPLRLVDLRSGSGIDAWQDQEIDE